MALVELNRVSKSFRKGDEIITPLDDVSLQIQAGEFVSLMGPSGTGKSTLLNLVSGIDRPDGGTIAVDGTDITGLSRSRLADWRAANLGYIFQTHNLLPVLTAYENVELPTLLLKLSSVERRMRVELALEAGAFGMAVLVLVAFCLARLAHGAWRDRVEDRPQIIFALATLFIVAAHSVVDYPLRTMALTCLAGVAAGLLASLPSGSSKAMENGLKS